MADPDAASILREFVTASEGGDEERALNAVKRAYRAFLAGELELDGEVIDPEISWEPPGRSPTAGEYRRSEIRTEVANWTDPFEDFEWEPTEVIPAGERWIVVGDMRGVGRSSGVEVREQEFHVWTARDGRIVRMQMFLERDEALVAAGLSAS